MERVRAVKELLRMQTEGVEGDDVPFWPGDAPPT